MQAKSLKHQMKLIYSTEYSLLFTTTHPLSTMIYLSHHGTLKEGRHSQMFTNTHYSFFTVVDCAKIRYSHQRARGLHCKITILLYEQMSHT